jgi:L-ribulose-5-phosphate 4-epimerase
MTRSESEGDHMSATQIEVSPESFDTPELSPHAELAFMARALNREGYDDFNVGHITYRQPDETFLILPADLGWDEARPGNALRIDIDGNLLEGEGKLMPAVRLQLEYHRLHRGCIWAIHQHPWFATLWSTTGRIPPAYYQRAVHAIGGQIAVYDDHQGPVSGVDAARAAAAAMGDASVTLLRNHGVFVVGDDAGQAYSRAVGLERRCRMAWYAESLCGAREMPEAAQHAVSELGRTKHGGRGPGLWEWAVRRELRADPALLS